MDENKSRCAGIARNWLSQDPLFLDTETTGLEVVDQICQIAIVDVEGNVVLDALVRPQIPIRAEAERVHNIKNVTVARCPMFGELWAYVHSLLSDRLVIIYNADYDTRMLRQSLKANFDKWPWANAECAMLLYAAFHGESGYYGGYKWQSLGKAAQQCGIQVEGRLHGAAFDAEIARRIVLHIAAWQAEPQEKTELNPTAEAK